MALSAATLGTELQAMVPAASEADGIDNFATAFENYFAESTCGGVSVNGGSLSAATTALKAAMVGINVTPGLAPTFITAGIVAFWGVVATSAASIWTVLPIPLVAAVPPAGLAGITAAVTAAGASNIAGALSLVDSANAMGAAIHTPNLGGVGNVTPPPPGITLPIL